MDSRIAEGSTMTERRASRDRRKVPRVDTDRRVRKPEAVGPLDAATLMNVSESTVLRLIKDGKLPAVRLGRQWRILLSHLRRGSTC